MVTGLAQDCTHGQLDGDADESSPLKPRVTLWVWKRATDKIILIDKKLLNYFGDAGLSPLCQIIRLSIQVTSS